MSRRWSAALLVVLTVTSLLLVVSAASHPWTFVAPQPAPVVAWLVTTLVG